MTKKTVQVVLDTVKQDEKTAWQKIKDWFYHSESVVLAYIVSLGGLVTGIIGSLDLSPLWTMFQAGTEFTSKQLTWMGVGVLGTGISMYIARVRGTKEIAGRLLPAAA